MASLLGVEAHAYRRYERGETQMTVAALAKLRHLTGISLCVLVAAAPPGSVPPAMQPFLSVRLPDRLRIRRQLWGDDLTKFAAIMGVSRETWLDYERGNVPPPVELMAEFCHRFGVSLDFLYLGRSNGVAVPVLNGLREAYPDLVLDEAPTESTGTDTDARKQRRAAPKLQKVG